ncbi:hypothetical protein JJB07_04515 [Tumebacillus sp. ITR2]|uniref:DUF4878 domain-containing protein n=1 Tax=Tumebacillus amylolyticus TaxID=2801339 RepID=A0ABS1J6K1_9BACL|nr:hypothetical protein [Tumebacillus amylolyticus]MBL0385907.1 hypothetical protein [Tumebacillus amylolyticus]
MQRTSKLITLALSLGVLAIGIGWSGSVYATQEEKKVVIKAAQDYVEAFTNHDIDELMNHVKDTRAQNDAELHANYESFIKTALEQHEQLKFISVEEVSSGTYQVNFEHYSDVFQKGWVPISLPMVKENGEWKLFVDGSLVVNTKK